MSSNNPVSKLNNASGINIIAFGHRRKAGKDTAVTFGINYLKSMGICNVYRLSFFEATKNICHQIYRWGGLEDAVYYENHPEAKDKILAPIGKTPRDIWIHIGESVNGLCERSLCEMTFQNLRPGIYLVSDLRRPIEASYVKKFGGINVRVENPRVTKHDDAVDSALATYDGWDEELMNLGTLKEYSTNVRALINKYLLK